MLYIKLDEDLMMTVLDARYNTITIKPLKKEAVFFLITPQ